MDATTFQLMNQRIHVLEARRDRCLGVSSWCCSWCCSWCSSYAVFLFYVYFLCYVFLVVVVGFSFIKTNLLFSLQVPRFVVFSVRSPWANVTETRRPTKVCFFVLFALFIDLLTDKVQPLSRYNAARRASPLDVVVHVGASSGGARRTPKRFSLGRPVNVAIGDSSIDCAHSFGRR